MLQQAQITSTMELNAVVPQASRLSLALPALKGWSLVVSAVATTFAALTVTMFALNTGTFTNEELIDLLTPPNSCEAPCWQGIRPGETTADEAFDMLTANTWVMDVAATPGKLSWWWNGEQPGVYDDSGRAFHGRIELGDVDGIETVVAIVLETNVPYGDIALTLGDADGLTLYSVPETETTRSGVVQVANFEDNGIYAFTLLGCPLQVTDFWAAPSMVAFGQPTLAFQGAVIHETDGGAIPTDLFRDNGAFCNTAQ